MIDAQHDLSVRQPGRDARAGATRCHQYHMFLGPKVPALLDEYGLADIIEYGWFGWVAKPLSQGAAFLLRDRCTTTAWPSSC